MKRQFCLALALCSSVAFAQQGRIGSVKAAPNPARAGQPVSITIAADGPAPTNCGMIVHFDDGSESRNVKIDSDEAKFPVTISKTYAKAGSYIIKAEGTKITTHFPCVGAVTTKLVVEGPAPAAKPAASAAACPNGYKMLGRVGKAGEFSCKAPKGVAPPAAPLACAEGLEYFVNGNATRVGCRKAKARKK